MVIQKALVAKIFLQTDEIKQWFEIRSFGEAIIGGMVPLLELVLVSWLGTVVTYPLDDCIQGQLVRDIEAKKYSIPFDVSQFFDCAQIWYARGILHLHANRLVVVNSIVDIGFVQRTGEDIGLLHISLQTEQGEIELACGK